MPDVRPPDPGDLVLAALTVAMLAQGPGAEAPGRRPGAGPPHDAPFAAETFDPLVLDGIRRGAYPGAALVIGRRDTILFAKGYGRQTWSRGSDAVSPDSTLYDLASLTKVIATTTALMLLVDRGQVTLDAPVARYLPEFTAPGTDAITVRHLLTHTSGLRATLPLHREAPDSAAARAMLLAAAPIVRPGMRVVYSDVNAMLLGEVVARVAGEPLDRFAAREIFGPLGLEQTRFRPPRRLHPRIAPTGIWRGHPIRGVVNDPNAHRLGGVAGHAGAFSTALDVARFAQFMLRQGALPDGRPLVRSETVRLFTTRVEPPGPGQESRALGWQAVPTGETVPSAGTLFGPRSFGHTGWTGTSLWIDPDRDLFVVLLTNRAYAPRNRRSLSVVKEVRGRVADAAARALDAR
ncbi:MAG TPA: serine hydrolase domain-containing protein [Gemmatimonadales bacterium]|nr:serine hydrolase domain-containing protein [Gemmatimonadales bacterium]